MVMQTKEPTAKQTSETAGGAILTKEKKKKKRKSKNLGNLHRVERSMAKAVRRTGDALAKGATHYSNLREKSGTKKKNGALRDSGKNLGKALRKTLKGTSKAQRSLTGGILAMRPRKRARKDGERAVKQMLRTFGF